MEDFAYLIPPNEENNFWTIDWFLIVDLEYLILPNNIVDKRFLEASYMYTALLTHICVVHAGYLVNWANLCNHAHGVGALNPSWT